VLAFADGDTWDKNQRGGFPALIDPRWGGSYEIGTHHGRHLMTYIGGAGTGYEAVNAPLSIGLAWAKKGDAFPTDRRDAPWTCGAKPLMSYDDADAQWWERLTQYKSTIYKMPRRLLGAPYVMFYNAGGRDATHPKGERIGIALSDDLARWRRYEGNPVFAHDSDGTITGDAQIVEMTVGQGAHRQRVYVMFYFSAFNPTREYSAYNTFAASTDLVNWQDWTGDDLIVPSKDYDELFAHKSCVVNWNDTVYHFYCAVNHSGQRGIALATNRFCGKSEVAFPAPDATGHRESVALNEWEVELLSATDSALNATLRTPGKQPKMTLRVPFNLDDYYGTQQGEHGNLHGTCVARRHFTIDSVRADRQYFLRMEGIGTYADITLNGHHVGRFDVGRTTETVCITPWVARHNRLEIKIAHPAHITDMPWVCGGCSSEWGFSEGSQPFGIFRPITLEVTDRVRIEPFGVHVWAGDSLLVETELKNYGDAPAVVQLVNKLTDKGGRSVARMTTDSVVLAAGETRIVRQSAMVESPQRWSPSKPYLYTVSTIVKRDGRAVESTSTPFGFRTISWPAARRDGDGRFLINDSALFVNGVCEYEHLLGQSHAFSREQIEARIKEMRLAGFNALREAHQPHNLYYQELADKEGLLAWPQFSAHIWYDTPEFRQSFKRHLVKWVKERRNSPSVVLWGLQNESTLPRDFAEECTEIIRRMDPTCGTQRLVTTCNGGEGTDWNVVQNWSGTYGGDVKTYGEELKRADQLLNGEYGAWRTLGYHDSDTTAARLAGQQSNYTEEAQARLLMTKVALAESVRDSVCGQFLWLLNSHDNPGRRQPDEAVRRADKVGPYNYKGLFSPWEQPVEAFYAYQRHYNPAAAAYANELKGIDVEAEARRLTKPTAGLHYLYRLNCGGDDYTDAHGHVWMQDNTQWSRSWGDHYGKPYQASQTVNDSLPGVFRTQRYGRHQLSYHFPAAKGHYVVELYFAEPWYRDIDAEGLRLFDVAVNDSVAITALDIWAQAHYGRPYKRTVEVDNKGDEICISFPRVSAGQAMIAAIAVATTDKELAAHAVKPTMNTPGMWEAIGRDRMYHTPDSLLPPKSRNAIEAEGRMEQGRMVWEASVGVAKVYALRFRYYNPLAPRRLHVKITDRKGTVYRDDEVSFLQTQTKKTKRKMTSITTGSMVNAGTYRVELSGDGLEDMLFDPLTIE